MTSTTVVNGMPDCIRNLLICSLIELDYTDQESIVCHQLFFKYQTQSGFSFASVVADYGEPYGRTEHYGELGELFSIMSAIKPLTSGT